MTMTYQSLVQVFLVVVYFFVQEHLSHVRERRGFLHTGHPNVFSAKRQITFPIFIFPVQKVPIVAHHGPTWPAVLQQSDAMSRHNAVPIPRAASSCATLCRNVFPQCRTITKRIGAKRGCRLMTFQL